MWKKLSKIILRIVVMSLLGMQTALSALEFSSNELVEESESQSVTFPVTPQDLYLDHENLLINMNGHLFEVISLRKNGNGWIAEASPHGNCSYGHPLCAYCGMCHTNFCLLHQRRCKASQ